MDEGLRTDSRCAGVEHQRARQGILAQIAENVPLIVLRPTGALHHEGDWEHITVRVDDAGEMVSAWYAHHDGGTRYLPSDLYFVEGTTHPLD